MKSGIMKSAGVMALAAVAALSFSAGDAEAKKVRWKMHSAFGKNLAVIGPVGYRIADWVNKASDGDREKRVERHEAQGNPKERKTGALFPLAKELNPKLPTRSQRNTSRVNI